MRCNRIHYGENFHIDVPVYHLDSSRNARALATQNDEWEDSDPKLIYLWFKKQVPEETRSQVRRLIRYLKAWAILNIKEGEGRPSAILLTVLVSESYKRLSSSETASEDEALAGILKLILDRLKDDQKVCNPVNTKEILSERLGEQGFLKFIDHLQKFGDLATRAVAASTEVEAFTLWSNVYEHFFPWPEPEVRMLSHSKQDSKILSAFTLNVSVKAERKNILITKKITGGVVMKSVQFLKIALLHSL
jgi:hypothetical protein